MNDPSGRGKVVTLPRRRKGYVKGASHGNFRHGHAVRSGKTPEYKTWQSMIQRCRNPKVKNWEYYGGRGIRICERWLIFDNFLADMGPRPPDHSLDRIDNDGHYEVGNVRWATRAEQHANRRPETVTLAKREAARRNGRLGGWPGYYAKRKGPAVDRVWTALELALADRKGGA